MGVAGVLRERVDANVWGREDGSASGRWEGLADRVDRGGKADGDANGLDCVPVGDEKGLMAFMLPVLKGFVLLAREAAGVAPNRLSPSPVLFTALGVVDVAFSSFFTFFSSLAFRAVD